MPSWRDARSRRRRAGRDARPLRRARARPRRCPRSERRRSGPLGHRGAGQGDRGDRHRRRLRPSAARSSGRRASPPRSRAAQLVGHCGPDGNVTEAFDGTLLRPRASATVAATCSTRRRGPAVRVPATPKDCAHGTAVAAVAARHEPTPGRGARRRACTRSRCSTPPAGSADFVDILLALDHVADLADAGLDIAAANLSLSSSATYPSALRHRARTPTATRSRSGPRSSGSRRAGIATTVATGNDAQTGSLGLPACVSNAIAVGASDLDDQIADFGNRGPTMELVAPGARRGQRPARPHGHPREPGARVGRHLVRRSARGRRLRPAASRVPEGHRAPPPRPPARHRRARHRSRHRRRLPPAPAAPARPAACRPACCSRPTPASPARAAARSATSTATASATSSPTRRAARRTASPTGERAGRPSLRSYAVGGSYAPIVGNFRGSARRRHPLVRAPAPAADSLWTGGSSRTFGAAAVTINGTLPPAGRRLRRRRLRRHRVVRPGSALRLPLVRRGGRVHEPVDGRQRRVPGGGGRRGRRRARRPRLPRPGAAADALWRGTATRGTWLKSSLTIGGTNERAGGRRRRRRRRRPAPLPGRPRRRLDLARRSRCRRRWTHRWVLAARGRGQRQLPAVGGRHRRRRA